jgi:hypothetical protein
MSDQYQLQNEHVLHIRVPTPNSPHKWTKIKTKKEYPAYTIIQAHFWLVTADFSFEGSGADQIWGVSRALVRTHTHIYTHTSCMCRVLSLLLLLPFTRPSLIIEHYWQGSDRIHCACWFLYVSTILWLTHRDCRIFKVRAWCSECVHTLDLVKWTLSNVCTFKKVQDG